MKKTFIYSVMISLLGAILLYIDGLHGDGYQKLHWYGYLGFALFPVFILYLILNPFIGDRK